MLPLVQVDELVAVVPQLLPSLEHADRTVRSVVVDLMHKLPEAELMVVAPLLRPMLEHKDWEVCNHCLSAHSTSTITMTASTTQHTAAGDGGWWHVTVVGGM